MADDNAEWQEWMDNPLATDQPEGTEVVEDATFHMQIWSADRWMPFSTPRTDRDEVTTIQAFHLNKHPDEPGIRVWKCTAVWELVQVPGDGDGQTPHEQILARNDAIKAERLAQKTQQPDE